MKKNKALRIAMALLVVVAITTCGMTGALAKYVDAFAGTDARAARAGLFKVVVGDGTGADFWSIPLEVELLCDVDDTAAGDTEAKLGFNTPPTKAELASMVAYANGEEEAQAYDGLELYPNIIVPGSVIRVFGTFEVYNLSEVDVEIKVDPAAAFAVTGFSGTSQQLRYSADAGDTWIFNGAGNAMSDALTAKSVTAVVPALSGLGGPGSGELFDIEFFVFWPFTGTDVVGNSRDTIIGNAQAGILLAADGDTVVVTPMVPCIGSACAVNGDVPGAHDNECEWAPAVTREAVEYEYVDKLTPAAAITFTFGVIAEQVD